MPKTKTIEQQIEQLARAVNRGFADTATKKDVDALRAEAHTGFKAASESLELIRADVREIRAALVHDLEKRVANLERHAGLVK